MQSYESVKAETIHEVDLVEALLDPLDVVSVEENTKGDSFPCANRTGLLYTGQRLIEVSVDFDRPAWLKTLQRDYDDREWASTIETRSNSGEVTVTLVSPGGITLHISENETQAGAPLVVLESFSPCGTVDD
ncbi:hypothetical protein D6T64_21540 [Cryobacterium melibiosiphilum]|uniref:Uncharacterized protein n=2 Tax=Cryobacterium melibiosiphilum TaxID=995039 RepID=A0A3A5MH65_9MICO|nr:hypothetical protein D6T64_21540 [Cryobacterium melibiosiphilum]